MKLRCIQHVSVEGPAGLQRWAASRGIELTIQLIGDGAPFPKSSEYDGLIILGGPMSVYETDRYPWLLEEMSLVRELSAAEKPIVGICLGAQLIAEALGGKVYPGPVKEIGFFPVQLTAAGSASPFFRLFPQTFKPLHWHGDTFDLPPEAACLISSEAYRNQAFLLGEKILGLQFHLETGPNEAEAMIEEFRAELQPARFVQSPEEILGQRETLAENERLLFLLMDSFFAMADDHSINSKIG